MNIMISRHDLQQLQAGEELGMPSYKVEGSIDGTPFAVVLAVEIDGRELCYSNGEGSVGNESDDDWHLKCQDIFDELQKNQAWLELHKAQTAEYYAKYAG